MKRSAPLQRHTSLRRDSSRLKRSPLGHCTPEQKARVADLACLVCGEHVGDCHPAHVVPRGVLPQEIADDVRAVVPLCFEDHLLYDNDQIDLSPHLEPRWRDSVEWAAGAVGLWKAVRCITGTRALQEVAEKALATTGQIENALKPPIERPAPTDAEMGLVRGWEGEISAAASMALGPPHPELRGAGKLRGE